MSEQPTAAHDQRPDLGAALHTVAEHLYIYLSVREDVERITALVQVNETFFGGRLGDSCVKLAADKLEELVRKGTL